jgi:hypothetical protein
MKNIVIKNIDKIIGSKIEDRILYKITDYKNSLNEEAYVFHFLQLNGGQGNGWNKEQNVHLVRIPKYNTDRYELFVMGLASGTVIELELKDIQNYQKVISAISISLGKAHSWWRGQRY